LGNGVLDARDENRAANTWSGNSCLTDFPAATICGVAPPVVLLNTNP
jgi:hypothetical protein